MLTSCEPQETGPELRRLDEKEYTNWKRLHEFGMKTSSRKFKGLVRTLRISSRCLSLLTQ